MRWWTVLAMAALSSGCSETRDNSSRPRPEGAPSGRPGDTLVVVAAAGGNPCQSSWDGKVVSSAELANRAFSLADQAVQRAGGIAAMTLDTIPKVRLEASPELTFACVGPVINAIHHGGIEEVLIKPSGLLTQPRPVFASRASQNMSPAEVTVTQGPGERIAWNGEATDMAGLRRFARDYVGDPVPGRLALSVAPAVTFASTFALMEALVGTQPVLLEPGREGDAAATVPSPPPPVPR